MIIILSVWPDPDPKQIIPDPDPRKSSGSDRIRIHNTACDTISVLLKCHSIATNKHIYMSWIRILISPNGSVKYPPIMLGFFIS